MGTELPPWRTTGGVLAARMARVPKPRSDPSLRDIAELYTGWARGRIRTSCHCLGWHTVPERHRGPPIAGLTVATWVPVAGRLSGQGGAPCSGARVSWG